MKKIALVFVALLFSMSFAFAAETVINGKVYSGNDINSPVVVGANVDVTCNETLLSSTTDDTGYYFVMYGDEICPMGSSAQACVGSVCNSGTVNDTLEQFNITGVDIFNVPEFSVITAMVALVGATAMFVVIRKRN